MAGRGRNMTLPAWMTTGGDAHGGPNDVRSPVVGDVALKL